MRQSFQVVFRAPRDLALSKVEGTHHANQEEHGDSQRYFTRQRAGNLGGRARRDRSNALKLMADKGIGAVMVMTDGQVRGILSERDYALQGRPSGTQFGQHPGQRDYDQSRVCHHPRPYRPELHVPDDRKTHPSPAGDGMEPNW